jgi:hypothetical protein
MRAVAEAYEVLGEEARDRGAPGGIGAIAGKPHRRKRFLGEKRAAGRERKQPQIRGRSGKISPRYRSAS